MKKADKKSRRPTKEDLQVLRQWQVLQANTDEEAWEILVPPDSLPQQWPVSAEVRKTNQIILKRILAALENDETDDRRAA
jgi:hypothetical protein